MTSKELKRWRLYRRLTQEGLARRLGCALGTVVRWEGGDRIPPMSEIAIRAILAIPPGETEPPEMVGEGSRVRAKK